MKALCIAIDDEHLALDVIRNYCQKLTFLDLVETFDNGMSAISYLKQHPVDMIFLDIQMKEFTGLQLLKSLTNPPLVIFTTAYDQYAVESFELDVLDYLLKPISFQRFVKAANKAYNRLLQESPQMKTDEPHTSVKQHASDFFFVKSGHAFEKIFHDDILYIKGERDYLKIVTTQKSILVLLNFTYFEDTLPENQFYRVHKSYMVAISKIKKIDSNQIFIGDTTIPIGGTYRTAFLKEVLNQKDS